MYVEAIAEFQTATTLSGRSPLYTASLAHAYAMVGNRSEVRKLLDELNEVSKRRYVPSYQLAVVYAGLDEKGLRVQTIGECLRRALWIANLPQS